MRKNLLMIILLFCATTLFAQWVQVNNGLDNYPPTTMWTLEDDMVVGTDGGGLYKTADNGDNWISINGNLGNLNVNAIRGFNTLTSLFVATDGGPFLTLDLVDYIDCTSTGLTNTDVNYFWWGDENVCGGDIMVGTNGGGVFGSDEPTGPWTPANTNLSGDALIINDMGGYAEDEEEFSVMATDGGTYWAINGATEWTEKNTGLTGDALKVKKIEGLGFFVLIATHDGLYYNLDLADEWLPLIPNEKLNVVLVVMSDQLPTGFAVMAFGENAFYSEDSFNWTQMDLGGITGEITTAFHNSTDLFIGVTNAKKDGKETGGVYRAPLNLLPVGIDEITTWENSAILKQNYPNPFSESTNISYSLKKSDFVNLKVYDFAGREIKTLVNNYQNEGNYSVVFDAENLANGIYSYKLQIGNSLNKTKKMMLVK